VTRPARLRRAPAGRLRASVLLTFGLLLASAGAADLQPAALRIDVHGFQVIEQYSGPFSYYRIVEDPAEPFVRALYRPGTERVTVGVEIPSEWRKGARRLRWRWRAMALPKGADECEPGRADSAASVYLTWKSGFRYYLVKYAWTTLGARGRVCDRRRGIFVVQDTVVRRSGGPVGEWVDEEIDPDDEFRRHFRDGDPEAEVPDLFGLGLLSDGDETRSVSGADYTGFGLLR
jgi:Protein of unknown function (DUF3047)